MGPEAKLYQKLKRDWNEFSFKVQALGPRSLNTYSMYKGSQIMELEACGLELEACCLGLDACYLSCQAWSLTLGTWIFLSLALVAYSFFFSEYWSMGSNRRSGILGPSTVALAPAAAVFKKIH
jgi:hypothetical protein